MKIIVYTKSNCPACNNAKTWLASRNYTFEEISLDDPLIRESFMTEYPSARTAPQIVIEKSTEEKQSKVRLSGVNELVHLERIFEEM